MRSTSTRSADSSFLAVLTSSRYSAAVCTLPFQRYVDRIGVSSTFTHAASLRSTSLDAIRFASRRVPQVIKTTTLSVISLFLPRGRRRPAFFLFRLPLAVYCCPFPFAFYPFCPCARQDTIARRARQMTFSPIHFGTSGWRAVIADEFTFGNVRLAVAAIAEHVRSQNSSPTLIVGYDRRFFSEEFARTAAEVLRAHGVGVLLCDGAAPTPAIAHEILRRKCDGAINLTASHNPAQYHGLKFSGPDGGPALPEVTHDIEARVARLEKKSATEPGLLPDTPASAFPRISPREAYLARLGELVNFPAIREANLQIVFDALHGCGAGYLDRVLEGQGIRAEAIRTGRDVLFDGTGPDVSEPNLAPLRQALRDRKGQVGLATDGDADRFGILDADGTWFSPNHILALLYNYLIETRGWHMPAARSVATTHLLDAVARRHGTTVYETPVGFKYVGELIKQDKIALGGEESAGLSIRGHVPEKDGILAGLLVAEMVAIRRTPLREQLKSLFSRAGAEYWPLRTNLDLSEEVKARAVQRLQGDFSVFRGRHVTQTDRTDGLKLTFEDGSWLLLRFSGTEPVVRVYTEAGSREAAARLAEEATAWILEATTGARSSTAVSGSHS